MQATQIRDAAKHFSNLGSMHDAKLLALRWDPQSRELTLDLNDFQANFHGLPEYKGPSPGSLVFSDVSSLSIDCEMTNTGTLRVFDISCQATGPLHEVTVALAPDGKIHVVCRSIAESAAS